MLTSIFVLSLACAIYFRSIYVFFISLITLLLFIYPISIIPVIIAGAVYAYLSTKGNNHESTKLNNPSDRDDDSMGS
jgi:hypothetical protein